MSNDRANISRRSMLKWMAVSTAGLTLAACAPAAAPGGTAATEASVATAELDILVCCYTTPEVALREQFNTMFMASHSGSKLNMELLAGGQNYFEKLQTLIAAGNPPDLFDMWEGYIQPYAKNGVLLNMDPLFESDSQVSKDDLVPAALDAASWDGGVYAFIIGFMPGPVSLYYNPAHFETAGIATPRADWTWDNLREAAIALTLDTNSDATPEQWGLGFDLWFVQWLYWIWSNGGDVFNADETQCTLADPKATEALQYWADLVNKDNVALSPSMLQSMQGGVNSFLSGAVSMYVGNTWDVATLKENKELNWQAVLSPSANNGNRTWYEHLWCWAISSESKQADLAWEFTRDFVLNRTIDPATPTIPPLKQLLDKFDTETNQQLGYAPLISLAEEPNRFRIPGSGAKWDKISGMIQAELDLVFTGEKTAAEAAATVAPSVDEELART